MNADKRDLRTYFVSFIQESMFIRVYLWLKNSFQTVSKGFTGEGRTWWEQKFSSCQDLVQIGSLLRRPSLDRVTGCHPGLVSSAHVRDLRKSGLLQNGSSALAALSCKADHHDLLAFRQLVQARLQFLQWD
jgi:hypothetical protein